MVRTMSIKPLLHSQASSGSFKHNTYIPNLQKNVLFAFYKDIRVTVTDITTNLQIPGGLTRRSGFLTHICFSLTESSQQAALLQALIRGYGPVDPVAAPSSAHSFWRCRLLCHKPGAERAWRWACERLPWATLESGTHSTGQDSVLLSYLTARKAGKCSSAEC